MAKDNKHTFVSVRAVANGWEVNAGPPDKLTCLNELYVFETWTSLVAWLRENVANNEVQK